jgi:hypothetical protein
VLFFALRVQKYKKNYKYANLVLRNLQLRYFFIIFAAQMKPNKSYLRLLNLLLVLIAYGYLAYRLFTFKDYSTFIATFKTASNWLCIIAILLLMPINVLLEACKWRMLLRNIEPMSLWGAQRQVYYGFVGAFITPYHAGDYPTRAILLKDKSNWSAAVGLGLVGSVALMIVELMFGIPATWLFMNYEQSIPSQYFALAFVVIILLLSFLPHLVRYLSQHEWKNKQMSQLSVALSHVSYTVFMKSIGWSMLRYAIWGLQLALALHFCGVNMTALEYLISIPFYYMVVSFFPSLPALNVAIRGSWLLFIFTPFTLNTAGITLAIILIWLINTVLPMIIGSILFKKGKTK